MTLPPPAQVAGVQEDAPPETPPAAPASGLGEAIRALGTDDFAAAFTKLATSDFLADQVVVFRVDAPGRMRTLLAESRRHAPGRTRALADAYADGLWPSDPNLPLLAPPKRAPDLLLRAFWIDEVAHGEYRDRLFAEPGLGGKLSFVRRADGHLLYVNLYRGRDRRPFQAAELARAGQAGDALIALLERHFALAADRAGADLAALERVIVAASREPGRTPLSAREAAVCAHITAGYSSEAIALTLGISQHSVVTYRKRAFAKLGIATQQELFALVLRRHRMPPG